MSEKIYASQDWVEEKNFLKTVNGIAPDESGNVEIEAGEGGYKWASRGYMREHVRDFQGWAHCVQYDPELGKAVGLVISGTSSHSNAQPWYRVEIDPKTGYMSDYEEIKVYNTDGVTEYADASGYMGSFRILSDGTYMFIDGGQNIYTSPDKGKNLTLKKKYAFSSLSDGSMFGLTELSNGRLLVGHGGQKNVLYYSDNKGDSWTSVSPANSGLGQQVYPEGYYVPFEPCFIECGNGRVVCYARASMNAYASYPNYYSAKEAAVYSISEDYGNTWTPWAWSTALTDMTANNGKVVVLGDKVHAVYGSRYGAEDNDFHLFYATTTLTDILEDKWETPVIVDVGHWDAATATNSHDCGYPSLFADENNNLFAVYYDGDGTGSAFGANWRLCIGTQAAAQVAPVTNEGRGSLVVGYTQAMVDALLKAQKSALMGEIAKIYEAIGQLPPDSGENDGSFYITSDLAMFFDFANSEAYDSTAGTITDKVAGLSFSATYGESNGGFVLSGNAVPISQNKLSTMQFSTDGFTVEYCSFGHATSNPLFNFSDSTYNRWAGRYERAKFAAPVSIDSAAQYVDKAFTPATDVKGIFAHHVWTFDAEKICVYVNGVLSGTFTPADLGGSIDLAFLYDHYFFLLDACTAYALRFYNRALSADEVNNNYIYESTLHP